MADVETLVQLLAIALAVAIAASIIIVTRRLGRFVRDTRAGEAFGRSTADLADRITASIDAVAARIDLVRHQSLDAAGIAENVNAALAAVDRYAVEAAALTPPPGGERFRAAIVEELERTRRALGLVEHGCSILAVARPGGRELEGQTAIKRGYLNLVHAREAIAQQAAEAVAMVSQQRRGGS